MTEAYTNHLVERLGKSNRAIDTLVAAIETAVGLDTLQDDEKWWPVLEAISATTTLLGPAMGEANFAMTRKEKGHHGTAN